MKILGLDVGTKRIGVAKADSSVRIAIPYGMVGVDGTEFEKIEKLARIYDAECFVIGLPRNNNGEETAQSKYVRNFAKNLKLKLPNAKIKFQDESLTSVLARENLKNKKGGINKKRGDVDTEAAVIILQDFLESLSRPTTPAFKIASKPLPPKAPAPVAETSPASALKIPEPPKAEKTQVKDPTALEPYSALNSPKTAKKRPLTGKPYKKGYKKWLFIRVLIIFLIFLGIGFISFKIWYKNALSSVAGIDCSASENVANESCKAVEFKIEDGDSVSAIADRLESTGLIKSAFAFKLFVKLNGTSAGLKAGVYNLSRALSVEELVKNFVDGTTNAIVFRLTVLPGETLADFKKRLSNLSYSDEEISAALSKTYSHPILAGKPADKNLEGYLFGDTYEFYQTDSIEKIITTMLDQLTQVVSKNNLKNKFESRGLTLYQGIILASIIQKEAGNLSLEDQKNVASVFYNRLENGMPLGSDVTVSYALSLLSSEERAKYTDNAAKLEIDSCYNTRKNSGLPCGPISNPGSFALIAAANPSETSYLYFLTGDDGVMYYSDTDSGHLQNIRDHCQELCNADL